MIDGIGSTGSTRASNITQQATENLSSEERDFIKDLVRVNNAQGADGIRGRESERIAWLQASQLTGWATIDGTELRRQLCVRNDHIMSTCTPTLQDCAGSAYVGSVKDVSDLRRIILRMNSSMVAPGLRPTLQSTVASAICCVNSRTGKGLAMAIAKERAASGTHLSLLNEDHGPFDAKSFEELGLAAANGVLGDLAAGEANISTIMGQFGLIGDAARDALQWRAVNGAAGRAVANGSLSFEQAVYVYGFYMGYGSTEALKAKA
ncbi:hypothetical protein MyNCGM683_07950 [Achromobacter xylosoxidans]